MIEISDKDEFKHQFNTISCMVGTPTLQVDHSLTRNGKYYLGIYYEAERVNIAANG